MRLIVKPNADGIPALCFDATQAGRPLVTSAGGASCACQPTGYFLALRCNSTTPVPNVPDRILFVNTFRCSPGAEPFFGVVTYRGYCYQVAGGVDHRPEDYPGVPIAAPAEIVCKPPEVTCDGIECLPVGLCCAPGCTTPPTANQACHPCECPSLARWRVVYSVVETDSYNATSPGFPTESLLYTNNVNSAAVFRCEAGQTVVESNSGQRVQTCVSSPPVCQPGDNSTTPSNVPGGGVGLPVFFGKNLAAVSDVGHVRSAQGSPPLFFVPSPTNPLRACSGETNTPSGGVVLRRTTWNMQADCFGGSYTFAFDYHEVQPWVDAVQAVRVTINWSYVPLGQCDNPPSPLVGEPPRVKAGGTRPMTFREVLAEILRGAGL